MYREFLDAGREGMQHMAYWTDDYQGLYDRALGLGYRIGHEGQIGGEKGRFAYFDTESQPGAHPGTVTRHGDRDLRHQRRQGRLLRPRAPRRRRLGRDRSDPTSSPLGA
jgi:hypothetical protein